MKTTFLDFEQPVAELEGKIEQLRTQFTLEQQAGMLSLDASLQRLVREGLVDYDVARRRARVQSEFDS